MNILYIGSAGPLSLLPFKQLLANGYKVSAVGVFNPIPFDNKIIALENASLSLAANQHQISLIDLSQPLNNVLEQCQQLSIDTIIMSCYAKRLPTALLKLAALGCFNMHPSLLPQYRGPEPLFWQMKYSAQLGVTWHHVTDDWDAGDIISQKKVFVDEGASYEEINQNLAEIGGDLLLDILSGTEQERTVQNAANASYYPYPNEDNFEINTKETAEQLYNFMCATRVFGHTYRYVTNNACFKLNQALDYDNNLNLDVVEVQQGKLYIPCKEGVLIASYTDRIRL